MTNTEARPAGAVVAYTTTADGLPVGKYTSLKEATKEEWDKSTACFNKVASPGQMADRALNMFKLLVGVNIGNMIDQATHGLQTATRAHRDGADEETVVCALLHDLGEVMSPINHGEIAAALLRPYVSPQNWWILAHHEIFQAFYYQDAAELPKRDTRERFRGHKYFDACVHFCETWDQVAFDPEYDTLPLSFFEPMVHRIFARKPYQHPDHEEDSMCNAKIEIAGGYPTEGRTEVDHLEEDADSLEAAEIEIVGGDPTEEVYHLEEPAKRAKVI